MTENISEGREYTGNIYKDKNVLIVNKTDVQLAFFNLATCCSPLGGGCMVKEQKYVPLIC